MTRTHPPLLDMTPDGQFRQPVRPPLLTRIAGVAVIVAVLSGLLGAAALAIWFALMLIPVAIGAAFVAYAAFRFQRWRATRG